MVLKGKVSRAAPHQQEHRDTCKAPAPGTSPWTRQSVTQREFAVFAGMPMVSEVGQETKQNKAEKGGRKDESKRQVV